MKPERIEELLRTRPSDERTYNRELPDLAMHRAPLRASGIGLPMGWAAAALAVGLVAIVGAGMFGPWQHSAAKPSAASRPAFSATGSMNATRQQASATLLKDGRVLVVGGNDVVAATNLAAVPSAELYDPATGKFTLTGSPHVAGVPMVSALLKSGRVLVIGCDASGVCASSLADIYDPSTGLFSAVPTTGSCTFCTATLLNDGRVLVARGDTLSPSPIPSLLFDPATDTFATTGSMTTDRVGQTATLLSDGRVLIAGGFDTLDNSLVALASAELYDPKTGTFSPTGPMTTARDGQTATLLADGRVLIAGGTSAANVGTGKEILASAELYDPRTGAFSPTGSMTTARIGHTANLLSDGRVLIAGGGNNTDITSLSLASAELYDPRTGTFSPAGSMTTARFSQTATLLSDGRVLIAGGRDSSFNPLSSTELFDPSAPTPTATAAAPTAAPTTAPSSSITAETLHPEVVQTFGTDQVSAAVLGPDGAAYVIDSTTGIVYWVSLNPGNYGARIPILASNLVAPDGTVVGRPKLLAVGGGDVLILTDSNKLWRWHPAQGDITGRGTLLKVNIPDSQNWGSDVRAIATRLVNANLNQYDLYVAMPSRQQIAKYTPAPDGSGYPTEAISMYLSINADVSTVDDMYVDGKVYLADKGKITRYDLGQAVVGWSPGRPSGTTSPFYTKLTADSSAQDAGLFYAFDGPGRRIVAFNKSDGQIAAEYTVAANTDLLQSLTGMFVGVGASGDKTLYWTEGSSLMSAVLSGPTIAPTATPAPTFFQYGVKSGDTMQAIANYFSVSLNDFLAANPQVTDPSKIQPGDILHIPPSGWHASPTTSP
jgi:LysM domain/Kelch motif